MKRIKLNCNSLNKGYNWNNEKGNTNNGYITPFVYIYPLHLLFISTSGKTNMLYTP